MEIVELTREKVVELLKCNEGARPVRIKSALEDKGFKNIKFVGRGKSLKFICELSKNKEEHCYNIFKNICINEYGYGKNFDYDKVLEIIEYHINNKSFKYIREVVEDLNISERAMHRHRNKLCGIILKNTEDCETDIDEQKYNACEKYGYFVYIMKNKNKDVLYVGKTSNLQKRMYSHFCTKNKEIWKNDVHTIEFASCKNETDMAIYEIYYINKYSPKNNKEYKFNKVSSLNIEELNFKPMNVSVENFKNGYVRRLYEITEDLKHDKDLLSVINKAIKYSKRSI